MAFSASRQRLGQQIGALLRQDRLEAALHVEAVVGIADGGIERGQFFGCGDDALGQRVDEPVEGRRHGGNPHV